MRLQRMVYRLGITEGIQKRYPEKSILRIQWAISGGRLSCMTILAIQRQRSSLIDGEGKATWNAINQQRASSMIKTDCGCSSPFSSALKRASVYPSAISLLSLCFLKRRHTTYRPSGDFIRVSIFQIRKHKVFHPVKPAENVDSFLEIK